MANGQFGNWLRNQSWMNVISPGLKGIYDIQYDVGQASSSQDKYLQEMMEFAQSQQQQGLELREQAGVSPQYQTPESINQMVAAMESLGGQDLPDVPMINEMVGKQQYEDRLASDTAARLSSVQQMGSGGGAGIGALASMGVENRRSMQDIAIESSRVAQQNVMDRTQNQWRQTEFERANQMALAGAYSQRAGYEDRAFDINEMMPWMTSMNRADMLEFGGQSNYWNAYGQQVGVQGQRAMNAEDRLFQMLGMGVQMAPTAMGL
jgi:hypothetical protein